MDNKKRNFEETRITPSYIAQPNKEQSIHRKKDDEIIHINPIVFPSNNNSRDPTYCEYKTIQTKKEFVFAK